MKIIVTAGELITKGAWEKFCAKYCMDNYAIADGRMTESIAFELTEESARDLGLLI